MPLVWRWNEPGIYAILNIDNEKIYIGSSKRLGHRKNCHWSELKAGEHASRYLQRAFNKSPKSFRFIVIELTSVQNLIKREQFWIDHFESADSRFGYNLCPIANSCAGIKRSPEFIERVASKLRGIKRSDAFKAKLSAAFKNRKRNPWSPQQRYRMSLIKKGHVNTREQIERQSASMRANESIRKPVIQFSLNGDRIKYFGSVLDAENQFRKRSNIHSVCSGKRRSAFGFLWRYASEVDKDTVVVMKTRKIRSDKKHYV